MVGAGRGAVPPRLSCPCDPGAEDPGAIGQAMLAGLQIYKHLAPGLVTPEVFERAFGLLARLDQER